MLQSEQFSKHLLFSPLVHSLGSPMTNYNMGNSSEKVRKIMDRSGESPSSQRVRRRKSCSTIHSDNPSSDTQQQYHDDGYIRLNGSTPDLNITRAVTFSSDSSQHKKNIVLTPSQVVLLQNNSQIKSKQVVGHHEIAANNVISDSTDISEIEMKNLKELLLLHLDIVQQQQAIIIEKDKVIAGLKTETKMLQTRLERMDRRLHIGKSAPVNSTAEATSSKLAKAQSSGDVSQPTSSAIRPPKQSAESFQSDQAEVAGSIVAKNKRLKLNTLDAAVEKTNVKRKRNCISKTPTGRPGNVRLAATNTSSSSSTSRRPQRIKCDGLLRVTTEYYTQQVQEYEELSEEIIPNSENTQVIEVPTYRVHVYSNCYSLEGTEDIDEQTYLKRHQRHENDEKKRKRWDLQRLREVQMIEKLKQNQSASQKLASTSHPSQHRDNKLVDNIFPRAQHVHYIELCDKLPVNVFGHPLPVVKPSEFSLPWYHPIPCSSKASTYTDKPRKRTQRKR